MNGPIAIGGTVSSQGDDGTVDLWTFQAAALKHLILEIHGGPSVCFAGIWEADADGNPIPKEGLVYACGSNAWCIHQFAQGGPMVIAVAGAYQQGPPTTPINGPYALRLRKYNLWGGDDILLKIHKSTC